MFFIKFARILISLVLITLYSTETTMQLLFFVYIFGILIVVVMCRIDKLKQKQKIVEIFFCYKTLKCHDLIRDFFICQNFTLLV